MAEEKKDKVKLLRDYAAEMSAAAKEYDDGLIEKDQFYEQFKSYAEHASRLADELEEWRKNSGSYVLKAWAVKIITPALSPDGISATQIWYAAETNGAAAKKIFAKDFNSSEIELVKEVDLKIMESYLGRPPRAGDKTEFR